MDPNVVTGRSAAWLRNGPWLGLLFGLLQQTTLAQGVYRIQGPDGRTVFSDKPPPGATTPARAPASAPRTEPTPPATGTGINLAALPPDLRLVVSKYPVTLYTGPQCAPCDSARKLLLGRGVPFQERTVHSSADAVALRSATGATSLPSMHLGRQVLTGFSEQEWSQYLEVAGYPTQSRLPGQWRNPAPEPLAPAPVTATLPPPPPPPVTEPAPEPARAGPAPANPAGIVF